MKVCVCFCPLAFVLTVHTHETSSCVGRPVVSLFGPVAAASQRADFNAWQSISFYFPPSWDGPCYDYVAPHARFHWQQTREQRGEFSTCVAGLSARSTQTHTHMQGRVFSLCTTWLTYSFNIVRNFLVFLFPSSSLLLILAVTAGMKEQECRNVNANHLVFISAFSFLLTPQTLCPIIRLVPG